MLAALNNIWPAFAAQRWALAFAFGLVHGFGFASVLSDLGLPDGSKLLSLLGFNLGVEIGQLTLVALFRRLAPAPRQAVPPGSAHGRFGRDHRARGDLVRRARVQSQAAG